MDPDDPERLIDNADGPRSPAVPSGSEGPLDVRRLERIFTEARALSGGSRQDLLERACSGNNLLRQRVDRLLAEDAKDDDDLGSHPTLPGLPAPLPGPSPIRPSRLGPFTILRVLGEGGMGVVYEAVQDMPRRTVALKVIRPGMISREVLSRFRHEMDILGRLEHPGIAHIHAAGEADGAPWFAMEFVRGVTLDRYVAAEAPDPRRLLELFVEICDAVHHAHQRGVVHRDLKPSNILVDEGGQPKVLDFGVARATDGASATMHTTTGQIVGTLSYMSPEQMTGSAHLVDRRSDVYALGVMLYEALSGRLPHRVAGLPLPEVFRVIRDEEPSRLGSLNTRFRGDVETITAKALAKDPERRYATTAELAADLRRHLGDEPILARDPSTFYQLRKFARRNRALVGGVMATLLVLTLGTVVSTTFAVREAAAKRRAERAGYRSAVGAAAGEIAALNGSRAREFLDQAPASLRGWEWHYLMWLSDRSLLTLEPGEKVGPLACSPDGRRVAAIGGSGEVHLWDLETGKKLPWRTEPIAANLDNERRSHIAFSQDSNVLLLWNGAENTTRAVEIDTGRILWEVPDCHLGDHPWGAAGTIACGESTASIVFRELRTGRELSRHKVPAGTPRRVEMTPDGERIIYDWGSGLEVYALPSWQKLVTTFGRSHTDSSRRRILTLGHIGSKSQMSDLNGRLQMLDIPWTDLHPRRPDVGVYGLKDAVAMADLQASEPYVTLLGHGSGTIYHTEFSADGKRVISGSDDRTLRVWDSESQAIPWTTTGRGNFAVSRDGKWTAEAGWGYVRLWDAGSGWPVWNLVVSRHPMLAVAFAPDSRSLAAAQDDGRLWVIDVASGAVRRDLRRQPSGVLSLTWSPGGRRLALCGLDGVARLVDSDSGREIRTFGGSTASAHVVAFSPDGRILATGGRGPRPNIRAGRGTVVGTGGVRLWDPETGRLVRTLDASAETVDALAIDPAGKTLVAGYDDGALVSWTIASGERKSAPAKGGEVQGLAFAPGGTRLVVGRDDQIDIVEPDAMEVLLSFATPEATAQAAAFSDHGSLVCAGKNAALMIFDSAPPPGGYERRAAARRAAALLDLYGRNAQIPDPASRLGSGDDLLDEDRRDAILYAKAFGISPSQMNSEALGCVRRPDATREEYELALKRIEAALPYFPQDVYFLRTLALAQLRLGDPARALRTIDRAARITPTDGEKPWAAYDLVRAVGNSKIGRRREAEDALHRLCDLVKDPEEAQNVETRNYLAEAQRTLGKDCARR